MLSEPRIVTLPAQPYVAISNTLAVADIPRVLLPCPAGFSVLSSGDD